jgi:hypothetical protein
MRCLLLIGFSLACASQAYAQCRQGSGPDHGDGIPYCSQIEPESTPSPQPVPPPQWQSFAAAVAWGDSNTGDAFIGVGKYLDEQLAREKVLEKCNAKGWANCAVAISITNGVVAVARDSERKLRVRSDVSVDAARSNIVAKCEADGVSCEVLAVYDGLQEYF